MDNDCGWHFENNMLIHHLLKAEFVERFSLVLNDEEQVMMVYNEIKKYGLLPFKSTDLAENRKSATESAELRKAGNAVYLNGADNVAALVMYTKSIAAAPYPTSEGEASEELALAFGNRSAVYFRLGKYEACLRDIEQAFTFKYPERLSFKLIERRAECYLKLGRSDSEGAAASYQSDLKDGPTSTIERLKHLHLQDGGDAAATGGSGGIKSLPRLSHGQHELIPAASAAVDIILHPEMGRHFVANRDIEPGDILLVEESFASVLNPEFAMTRCNKCLKRSDAMIPCKTCDTVMYCSEECRSTSWQKSHSIECQLNPAMNTLGCALGFTPVSLLDLPLRILFNAASQNQGILGLHRLVRTLEESTSDGQERIRGFDQNGCYSSDFATIHNLMHNNRRLPIIGLVCWNAMAACLLNCLEAHTDFFTGASPDNETSVAELKSFTAGLLLRIIGIQFTNAFPVQKYWIDSRKEESLFVIYGKTINSTASLLNHSCNPNAGNICHFEGDTIVVVATRPIQKGDGIFIRYKVSFADQDITTRKQLLQKHFNFDCKCQACVNDWPQISINLPSHKTTYLCEVCHVALVATTATHVRCSKCKKLYHLSSLEERREKIIIRLNQIAIKLKKKRDHKSSHNYTSELVGIVKTVHSFIQSPNLVTITSEFQLFITCMLSNGNVDFGNE